MRKFVIFSLLTASLFLFIDPAFGSFGGANNIGPFNRGATGDSGLRELIHLKGRDGLLSGKPQNSAIKLITVYAPGAETGHLILRERKLEDGTKSLLLTVPDRLSERTVRATIYAKKSSMTLSLLEHVDGKWRHNSPVVLRVNAENGDEAMQDDLLVFSLRTLGNCFLLEGDAPSFVAASADSDYRSASVPLGGAIRRGVLPVVVACLLLAIGWVISEWLHKKQ
jgi:hypothetical protein